jgi:hypothetical protein
MRVKREGGGSRRRKKYHCCLTKHRKKSIENNQGEHEGKQEKEADNVLLSSVLYRISKEEE